MKKTCIDRTTRKRVEGSHNKEKGSLFDNDDEKHMSRWQQNHSTTMFRLLREELDSICRQNVMDY